MSYLLKAHRRECEEVQGRCCLPLKDLPSRERSPTQNASHIGLTQAKFHPYELLPRR
jgi:hypothetical protein